MKKIKHLFFIVCIGFLTSGYSQIIRGPTANEFFLRNEWYFDGSYTHSALFYSDDHGQTIQVNYEYGFPGGPPSLAVILDDAQPGVLYNKPYYYSNFMISYNYGTSWEQIEINPTIGSYFSGKVPGEIFHSGFSNEGYLLKSVDYGQLFDTINTNVKYRFTVGVNPEILYGINTIYGGTNQYFLNISHDNGLTFEECLALDTSITGLYLEDIYRGANLCELYLVSYWIPDHYKIYFSSDDGHTWQFRYRTVDIDYWSFSCTPGSESGTFYMARMNMDPTETHTWLYIDYSSDTAHSFISYFHDLTPDVGIQESNEQSEENIELRCFPNPVDTYLYISNLTAFLADESSAIIEIYNTLGDKIEEFQVDANTNEFRINTGSYHSGVYIIALKSENQILSKSKFVIVK